MNLENDCIQELRIQLHNGKIQKGYKTILAYLLDLRSNLRKKHTTFDFPGNLYHGYMDMSYFAVVSPKLKDKGLKIAVVFNYEAFKLEIWLAGLNKAIQKRYLQYFKDKKLGECFVPDTAQGYDSIVEDHIDQSIEILITEPDMAENRIIGFIQTIEGYLENEKF
jgi:hypothetical protein